MKKIENYRKCLDVLEKAEFDRASDEEIYRMGVAWQFDRTFELSWKALQAVMRLHGVSGAESGSPRDMLKLGYSNGFISDSEIWLLMLNKRNDSIHIYDEEKIDELLILIRDSFIPAFEKLASVLVAKEKDAENGL